MRNIEGIIDVKSSMEEGYPEIQILFNRAVLASQDMTINSVGSQIRNKIEGEVATRFIESDREVDIRVRLSEDFRDRVDKISRINVRNGLGVMVPLKALADIQMVEGPAEIRRILQQKHNVTCEKPLSETHSTDQVARTRDPTPSQFAIIREDWNRKLERMSDKQRTVVRLRLAGVSS